MRSCWLQGRCAVLQGCRAALRSDWICGSCAPQLVLLFHTQRLHPLLLLDKAGTEVSNLQRANIARALLPTEQPKRTAASCVIEAAEAGTYRSSPVSMKACSHRPRAAFPSCLRDFCSVLEWLQKNGYRGLEWTVRSPGRIFNVEAESILNKRQYSKVLGIPECKNPLGSHPTKTPAVHADQAKTGAAATDQPHVLTPDGLKNLDIVHRTFRSIGCPG